MDDRRLPTLFATAVAVLALATPAFAHVERASYWPDPAADCSIAPCTGGQVPEIRSLDSALDASLPGDTRVVCQPDSLDRVNSSVANAVKNGYDVRPTDHRSLSKKEGKHLVDVNAALFKMCAYREIQPAVVDSRNNDRVVIMPGVYTEPAARSMPTQDPACDGLRADGDRPGEQGGALSYKGEYTCPNDANLIAVMGREPGPTPPPSPPLWDRRGIPDLGPCVRCNLQMEGSGVSPDDVVVEAGDASKGNRGPGGAGHAKDVGIRADRADGFVLRNLTVRHAGEHGIYVLESDGYVLDRFKSFYNGLYGTLAFVEDHGVQQNCEAAGHSDSGIYPGAAADTGWQRADGTAFRLNQEIRWCDLHHNMAGYSATNGNAIWVHDNNFYDNALGLTTDVVTGAGHPGFPGDSQLIERNNFYSNNFNLFAPDSDVKPAFPFPSGTGMWIAGGNHHTVRDNHFWNNWRRGTMLFSVPDAVVCGPAAGGNEQAGCDPTQVSTSHYNQTYGNHMDQRPDGTIDRNGTDFWWDAAPGARGNCWWGNQSPTGITSSPLLPLPNCDDGRNPDSSLGTGSENEIELGLCAVTFESGNYDQPNPCPWLTPPSDPDDPQPGVGGLRAQSMTNLTVAPAIATQAPADIPLGQAMCKDWNAAQTNTDRQTLVDRIQAFVGGSINGATTRLGQGPQLNDGQTAKLFDYWCDDGYAQSFLLYKLYAFSADFQSLAVKVG